MTSLPVRLARAVLALAVALAGLVAVQAGTAASAGAATGGGSIVFVKNHNVWIADGDGGHQRRITSGGTASNPWMTPTQSDGGVVVAVRGTLIYRMNQWGRVLNTIDPPALVDSNGYRLDGRPSKVAVSPDGGKIAYTYHHYSCGWGCYVRTVTGFTSSTRVTSPDVWGVTHYDNPQWITNSRVFVNGWQTQTLRIFDLARGDFFWFDEDSYTSDDKPLSDPALSRNGRWAAAVRSTLDDTQLLWYKVSGNVTTGGRPPIPTPLCATNTQAGFANPTFSPDSTALAWEEPDGIWVEPHLADCSVLPTLTIRGGSEPSWSPAQVQTTRPADPKPRPRHFRVVKAPKVTGKAKVGRTVRANRGRWSPSPRSYRFQWLRNGRAIKGATKPRYRLVARDRRKRVSVRVTVRRPGYVTATRTSKGVRARR